MSVAIFDAGQRGLLLGAALLFIATAWLLKGRPRWAGVLVAVVVAAAGALAVLAAEQIIGLMVQDVGQSNNDYNDFRWVLLAPWSRIGILVGVVAALLVVVLAWRASIRMPSPWRRAALIGLRASAAAMALVLFLEPAIELRQVAREPNRVAVLVDVSASMALREEVTGPSRSERARLFIERSAPVFEAWRAGHHLDFYEFADALTPATEGTVAVTPPTGQATLIRQALEQTRAQYEGRDLAGVVLVSDGVGTGDFERGASDVSARDFLRGLGTRVHTAWVGRPGLKDVAVARVLADEFAFVRTAVRVEAVIRSTGYAERRIRVTLSRGGEGLREQWVTLAAGESQTRVAFDINPPRVGKYVYEIETAVADDEAVAENNRRSFVLRVIRDKIRVLQVAGQPSWDVRSLRGMLEQNPNVDLISFFILRTGNDVIRVPNDEMSLIPFPTHELFRDELPSFDLIILQNFAYGPYGIEPYLEHIRAYVEGGGGLVMLGGSQSFTSGGYDGTPVATALPVELYSRWRLSRVPVDTRMFSPQLTETGTLHPITSLRYEPRDNLAVWASLPELEGVNLIVGVKPGAAVLATHPRLKTARGEPLPVMVAGEYGNGRTLAVTTDSLWRYGFVAAAVPGDDGRHYDTLWDNVIRWLIHDPELAHLHVDSDAVTYEPGASVRLSLRLTRRDYTPLAGGVVSLELSRGSDPSRAEVVATKDVTMDEGGAAIHELGGQSPGVYRVRATAMVEGRATEDTDIFLVREGSAELDQPGARPDLLRDLATATGGLFLGEAQALPAELPLDEPRIVRVDRRTDVELWSRPALLALVFLFLGLEWVLRQRSGYL